MSLHRKKAVVEEPVVGTAEGHLLLEGEDRSVQVNRERQALEIHEDVVAGKPIPAACT